jgi:ATP/maltotriose-dependent transcriptional regulator MalT
MTLARRLLAEGDADGAVLALERARARGHTNPAAYFQDAELQPLLQHPRYLEMLQEMTHAWIARADSLENPTVASLMGLAQAQLFLGQVEPAFANIDRALAKAGPGQREMIEQFRSGFEEAIRSQGGATP